MATDVKTTQPKEYYRKFLEQEVRPDGRELGEIRPTTLNIGSITTANGSALVKLGNTTVICGIKGELCAPKAEEPKKGFIVPNVELPPLCSPQFRPGPPAEQAQIASYFIDELIRNSKCVRREDLCLIEGKTAWVLYCDLVCLDYDGNLLDACCLALLAALKTVRLPKVTENEETLVMEVDTSETLPLHVATQPVATSFAVFDDQILFADPTREEETLATSSVTIVTLEKDELCLVHKPGGSSLSEKQMQDCISRAGKHGRQVRQLIDETIHDVER